MRRYSPYNYGFDNPIRFIDPDGMAPVEGAEELIAWAKMSAAMKGKDGDSEPGDKDKEKEESANPFTVKLDPFNLSKSKYGFNLNFTPAKSISYGNTFKERLTNVDLWKKVLHDFLFGSGDPNLIKVGFSSDQMLIVPFGGGIAKTGANLVYEGLDAAGVVRYVGITEREAAIRFGEHLNSGTAKSFLDYRIIDGATGLSKTQARIWEQTLINQYGLGKNGGQLLNKVNSIAPKYWWQYGIK